MTSPIKYLLTIAFALPIIAMTASAEEFETLFNGKDLSGWKGLDGFWSVQDGAIVGETTAERKIEKNTFLVWQGGDVTDFELTASVRFKGNNSGVQLSWLLDQHPQRVTSYLQRRRTGGTNTPKII